MTVAECQQKMTSTEFVMWNVYLDQEVNEFHREDYYMAQIALEARRGWVNKPQNVELGDMILKFTDPSKPAPPVAQLTTEEAAVKSKAFWFGLTGYKED